MPVQSNTRMDPNADIPIDLKVDNLSIWSQYGIKPSEIKLHNPRSKKTCAACKTLEKNCQFKCCLRCVQVDFPDGFVAVYCSESCQAKHWKYHRYEHKIFETNPELFMELILKNGDVKYISKRDDEFYSDRFEQKLKNKRLRFEQNSSNIVL